MQVHDVTDQQREDIPTRDCTGVPVFQMFEVEENDMARGQRAKYHGELKTVLQETVEAQQEALKGLHEERDALVAQIQPLEA